MSDKNDNPRMWLPLNKTFQRGNKTTILIIPGASLMDRSELKDIIQWQTEKINAEPVRPQAVMPSKDVKEMLLDFARYIRKKRTGYKLY